MIEEQKTQRRRKIMRVTNKSNFWLFKTVKKYWNGCSSQSEMFTEQLSSSTMSSKEI